MNIKKITSITTGLALVASIALAIPAFAQVGGQGNQGGGWQGQLGNWQGQNNQQDGQRPPQGRFGGPMMGSSTYFGAGMPGRPAGMHPGVFGTVTAVNGNIITITSHPGFDRMNGASTTPPVVTPAVLVTYTVDATNATVTKNNASSTVSSIAVGDTIAVQGTVTGTNVVATSIFDGIMNRMGGRNGTGHSFGNPGQGGQGMSSTSPILGNGEPVIAGTISAISSSTLTVTTTSNVTYTVDATNAKILEGQNTVTLSSVVVGNKVLVQGTVNGTSITASTVIDQSLGNQNPGTNQPGNQNNQGKHLGFFGGIGQFFSHLFGF